MCLVMRTGTGGTSLAAPACYILPLSMRRALLLLLVLCPAVAGAQIPVLQAAPASLAFVLDGRQPAAPQQVRVRNLGSGTLRWTARASAAWILVSPPSGSGPAVLNVTVDAARLAPGRHEGRITVDAPDADDSPAEIAVTVEVAAAQAIAPLRSTPPEPALAQEPVTGGSIKTGAAAASAPDALRVDRRTLPPATRNLPYNQAIPIAGGTPPYAVRIVEGRLPAGLVLSQGAISGTARVQGYYPFVVSVTDASSPPATIAKPLGVRVIILQPDTALVVNPPAISLRLAGRSRDGRAAIAVGSGRQKLEWTAIADVPWLRLAPAEGLSPSTLQVIIVAGRLSPGTHLGTVTVTMEGAPNSPASIPVQVAVPR